MDFCWLQVYVLHAHQDPTSLAACFDFLSVFQVQLPILSMTAATESCGPAAEQDELSSQVCVCVCVLSARECVCDVRVGWEFCRSPHKHGGAGQAVFTAVYELCIGVCVNDLQVCVCVCFLRWEFCGLVV
jgi:hypothetical protein